MDIDLSKLSREELNELISKAKEARGKIKTIDELKTHLKEIENDDFAQELYSDLIYYIVEERKLVDDITLYDARKYLISCIEEDYEMMVAYFGKGKHKDLITKVDFKKYGLID